MNRLTIDRKITIKATFTPDDWQLYTASFADEDLDLIAMMLNRSLENAVASSQSAWEAKRKMSIPMQEMSQYGANDTEPMYFLDFTLRHIFGEKE